MRKTVGLLLAAATLVGVTGVATADGNGPPVRVQRALGLVLSQKASPFAQRARGAGNLAYHGGPVQHASNVYAIYWGPSSSFSSDYQTIIDQYFTDVAHDSTLSSNVYYSDTQYSDSAGKASYGGTFSGAILDPNLPQSGCSDTVSQTTVCLTDAQVQAEVQKVAKATGLDNEYFVFTGKGVGSCLDSSHCAFSYYCAYHSSIGGGTGELLYANMPYADTVPSACDSGQRPNNSDADATLNVTSHEHNETITDPNGNAWFDNAGYENGDKCAWYFGKSIGSNAYGSYNQLINNHPYYLQEEYSNASRSCVLTGT